MATLHLVTSIILHIMPTNSHGATSNHQKVLLLCYFLPCHTHNRLIFSLISPWVRTPQGSHIQFAVHLVRFSRHVVQNPALCVQNPALCVQNPALCVQNPALCGAKSCPLCTKSCPLWCKILPFVVQSPPPCGIKSPPMWYNLCLHATSRTNPEPIPKEGEAMKSHENKPKND